jgi:cytochrome P450
MEFNPFDHETQANPYPVYRWMRDEAPVYHNEKVGFWALSRYDDVLQAHLDPTTFTSGHGPTIEVMDGPLDALVGTDDPAHEWQRKLVSRLFTPRAVNKLENHVRAVAGEILDAARERNGLDVVRDFSGYLPMVVISEMLGLPVEVRAELRELSDISLDRGNTDELGRPGDDSSQRAQRRSVELVEAIVEEKSKNPGDDIASVLLTGRATDRAGNEMQLSRQSVIHRLLELLAAGHETTAKLIASGVVALTWYPDQREELIADASLIPGAVEEMLRWDPPSQYQGRWVDHDVNVHGTTIPGESRVVLVTGAANHDERAFTEPELFDIHRKIDRHVTFGFGIHLCVGAALARLESRIAFEELLVRYPHYELGEPIKRAYSSNVRGLASLPIAFEPAAP